MQAGVELGDDFRCRLHDLAGIETGAVHFAVKRFGQDARQLGRLLEAGAGRAVEFARIVDQRHLGEAGVEDFLQLQHLHGLADE